MRVSRFQGWKVSGFAKVGDSGKRLFPKFHIQEIYVGEMLVAGNQFQPVSHRCGGNPDVVFLEGLPETEAPKINSPQTTTGR
jgi:hypothetical protein